MKDIVDEALLLVEANRSFAEMRVGGVDRHSASPETRAPYPARARQANWGRRSGGGTSVFTRRGSPSTFRCGGSTTRVCRRACAICASNPGALSFEPLETICLDKRDDRFSRAVDQIKALGIDIEIDDFGAGYAVVIAELPLQAANCRST
jgi:hypothetical protein